MPMLHTYLSRAVLTVLFVVAPFMRVVPAEADVISINLVTPQDISSSGGLLSSLPAPYGVVTVNRIDPSTAIVSFSSSISNGNILLFASTVGVRPNAQQYSVTDVTASNSGVGFSSGTFEVINQSFPGQNMGEFGLFVGINNVQANMGDFGNFAYAMDFISFTLHTTSTFWDSASDVLRGNVTNGFGYEAAANVVLTPYPANVANGISLYGLAASEQVLFVAPSPGTLLLISVGLLSVMTLARKKRRAT